MSKYRIFSGPYFSVFGLNTRIYLVDMRIKSKYEKYGPEKNYGYRNFSLSDSWQVHVQSCVNAISMFEQNCALNKKIFLFKSIKSHFRLRSQEVILLRKNVLNGNYKYAFIWSKDRKILLVRVKLASIYLLKVNKRNTRTSCEICWKLTLKTPERRHWFRSGVFTVGVIRMSLL